MKLLGFGKETLPSVVKDPFNKSKITSVSVRYSKGFFNDKFTAYGRVEFEDGNTKGEQQFTGDTFDDVVLSIKSMIENLK